MEVKGSELVLLKSKYKQPKDSISTHCELLQIQINTNECTSTTALLYQQNHKRKIRGTHDQDNSIQNI